MSVQTIPQPDAVVTERQAGARRAIAVWLFAVASLVFLMVIVGGATRLTDSGLSITEWRPVTGAIPPLSAADWQAELEKYRQIPEYKLVNRGMSLDEFKRIYWWEWGHRLLGRLIGVAFLVPFVWFVATRRIERALVPGLLAMFALGGLQGGLGWYMVMSGLSERVDVSQYRLAAHLGLAVVIYGYMLWVALGLWRTDTPRQEAAPRGLRQGAVALVVLIFLQIIAGAFVAGLDAGLTYNSWPLMDGAWVPGGLLDLSPWWRNAFENLLTVQFNHRLLGYVLAAAALWHYWRARSTARAGTAGAVLIAVLCQIALGIWTLLAVVPIGLGLAHQAGALIVFTAALVHARALNAPAHAPALRGV